MKRIPTLDGLRGVAIVLVLLDHGQNALVGTNRIHHLGPYGVNLFFVLSGFLITTQIVERGCDLKTFYVRRFFRLMPAAWLFLFVFWLLGGGIHQQWLSPLDASSCLFFFRNYVHGSIATLHFWSLSLEEQFYLTWPLLLSFAGKRRAVAVAIVAAVGCGVLRFYQPQVNTDLLLSLQTHLRADGLCVGCVLAILLSSGRQPEFVKRMPYLEMAAAAVVIARATLIESWSIPLYISAAYAVFVWRSVAASPDSLLARMLSFTFLRWLGRISYSLYLWQQPAVVLGPYTSVSMKPVLMLACFAAGCLSYYFVEQPLIQLGAGLLRPVTVPVTPASESRVAN